MIEEESLKIQYSELFPTLEKFSESVASDIKEHLIAHHLNYHMVDQRAKGIDSFIIKSRNTKYTDPINQITDQAGIRVITYVESQLSAVAEFITQKYDIDKSNSSNKSNELGENSMGYKSLHFVGKYKEADLLKEAYAPFSGMIFEIQVRTLLQHAWAEIEHDSKYKFKGKLPSNYKRRFNLVSASLEILDNELDKLSNELTGISQSIQEKASQKDYNVDINIVSLGIFLNNEFEDAIKKEKVKKIEIEGSEYIIRELKKFGITKLSELLKIIPDKFESELINTQKLKNLSHADLLRTLMIKSSSEKYYSSSFEYSWNLTPNQLSLFESLGLDVKRIIEFHKIPLGYNEALTKIYAAGDLFPDLRRKIPGYVIKFIEEQGLKDVSEIRTKDFYRHFIYNMLQWNELIVEAGSIEAYIGVINQVLDSM